MARKKVQLAWIENQTSRKATFRKRRDNLIKKVREISVLAGTDACGIILSPFEGDPPLFYPPSINEILNRFFSLPEIEQFKRMVTVESYLNDEINKKKEMVQKERRKVREIEVSYTMNSIHFHGRSIESLSCDETSELFWYFEELKKKCELMITGFGNNSNYVMTQSVVAPPSNYNNENLMMNDDTWLAANNVNMLGMSNYMHQPVNFDQHGFDLNNNGNYNGFGVPSDLPDFNMAGTNLNDPAPYHDMSSFGSSYNDGFMSNNGAMVGPSGINVQCPQPSVGSQLGFFGSNSGC